ncbi:hypothetical protein M0811_07402 [Anaeramoeba ignava]|uniref:UDP-N-acetylglucosamine diphosphorylase n=1 Tax=Anaeramoeba ignava TaxID=1746090 RepID=A0A9Q0RCR8_ANAIG|nr:hypothetical protein M0811_07402 [Anaeramoeba ignava]
MEQDLKQKFINHSQQHLFDFFNELNEEEKKNFISQLKQIDFEEIDRIFETFSENTQKNIQSLQNLLEPIPNIEKVSTMSLKRQQDLFDLGLKAIQKGEVCCIALAGGQGTRLGFDHPKGTLNIEMPSQKSLFEMQAEQLLKLQSMAKKEEAKTPTIPWYILTSDSTHEETVKFFEENSHFGIGKENITFFEQGKLPGFNSLEEKKIILTNKGEISFSPNGNGGIYKAIKDSGVLEKMSRKNIKYIHVYSVDNCLIKMADPVFTGYCIEEKAECGAKVVAKLHANERVGVLCNKEEHVHVIEYSEIGKEKSEMKDKNGDLLFNSANICNHLFTFDFLKKICLDYYSKMPYHKVQRMVNGLKDGIIQPFIAIKFEQFIFDVFPFAKSFAVLQVERENEFSPIKNKTGNDSIETAKIAISSLNTKLVQQAGGFIDSSNSNLFEISPLVSYNGENLQNFVKGKTFKLPFYLNLDAIQQN